MNLSHEELERELAALKPVAPSEALESSIDQSLKDQAEEKPDTLIRFWPIIALAAAACLTLVAVLFLSGPDIKESTESNLLVQQDPEDTTISDFDAYQPLEAEYHLVEAVDEGIVFTEENEPVRRLRYQFIDAVTLVNKNDGSVFRMELPREEILFVPVTLL